MLVDMFPFQKKMPSGDPWLPVVGDLSKRQRAALPGVQVVHLEWRRRMAFGKEVDVLLLWLVGRKLPLRWDKLMGKWVDDNGK